MVGKPVSTIIRLPRLKTGGTFRIDATRKSGQSFRAGVVIEPFDSFISISIRDESRSTLFADFVDIVSQHASFAAAAPRVAEAIGRALGFDAVAIWETDKEPAQRTVWWSATGGAVRESGLVERVRRTGERAIGEGAMLFPIIDRTSVAFVLEAFGGTETAVDDVSRIAATAERFVSRTFTEAQDLSDGGVFEMGPGNVLRASDGLYRIFGLEPQSRPLTLRYFLRHTMEGDRDRLRGAIELARQRGALDVKLRIRCDDGEIRFLRVHAKVRELRVIGKVQDITEEETAARERLELQRQLGETRRLSSLGKLAATMAHEFNNVLMGISTFAEVLRRRTAGEVHVQNAVAQIQQSLGRGRRITNEILRFTREPAPNLATIDVRRWLSDFLPEASALTGGRAQLEAGEELFIRGDMALLNQALANLVINARDAAPEGPIRIVARATEDEKLDLMIADRGTGIAPEIRERIFEPLFTTKRSGTGLGLAVVHQVISAQGGTIDVESEVGRGTEFHLRFPLFAGEVSPADKRRITNILLVEDDPAVTFALDAMLEAEGIKVRSATSGSSAIHSLGKQTPDVVLLDIGLPDVSGVDVYNEIAMHWPALPVVFITAEFDDTAVARFLRQPHVGFLRKPFEAEQLLETLSRITAIKRLKSERNSEPGRSSNIRRPR
jgi:signal transduction histidine kinase/CheY-like chemotaxis protein